MRARQLTRAACLAAVWASGGRGRTIAVEGLGRIEQALHHLSKPRELDREVELEQRGGR